MELMQTLTNEKKRKRNQGNLQAVSIIINPRHACAARITVVSCSVCVSVTMN